MHLLTNTNARQEYLCAPKFMLVLKFSACAGQKVLQQELEQQQLQNVQHSHKLNNNFPSQFRHLFLVSFCPRSLSLTLYGRVLVDSVLVCVCVLGQARGVASYAYVNWQLAKVAQ